MTFNKDFFDSLVLLIKYKIEYLIVVANAVSRYGYPRYTGEPDIWIKRSDKNVEKLLKVTSNFGFGSLGLKKKDFLKPNWVLGYPPIRIDIINDLDGVTFDECYSRKNLIPVEGLELRYIHYSDLVKNKLSTGRGKDKIDVEEMQKVKRIEEKKK